MPTRKLKPLEADGLVDYAARLLGGRAYSAGEMREKLRARAARPEAVLEAIARLKQSGYLNDAQLAGDYASARRDNRGFGKMRVLRDLRQRRIAPALASKAAEDAYAGSDETVLIEAFLARKFRGKPLPEYLREEKHLAAAFRRLRYAGFSAGNSIRVLKRYAARTEALDALESGESDRD